MRNTLRARTLDAAEVEYRRAEGTPDFLATYHVFLAAANDLRARSHRPELADTEGRRTRAIAFREHAFAHDRDGFWIAEARGRMVGFAIATARPGFWHLNALHVLPEFQGRGVGRELLLRCLAYGRGPKAVSTVISEAAQPVSNALYARHGLYQWLPLIHLDAPVVATGPITLGRDMDVWVGASGERVLAALDATDAAVLGYSRTLDHRLWIEQPDLTLLLLGRAGDPVGYAYVSTFGGIGPVAVRFARLLPPLLAHSIRVAVERGVTHPTFVVPGLAHSGLRYLLAHGARYGESINLLLASRPFGHLDRYFPSASDALF